MAGPELAGLREIFLNPIGPYQLMMAAVYPISGLRQPNFDLLQSRLQTAGKTREIFALRGLRDFRMQLSASPASIETRDLSWLLYFAKICQNGGFPHGRTLVDALRGLAWKGGQNFLSPAPPPVEPPAPIIRSLDFYRNCQENLLGWELELIDGPCSGHRGIFRRWNGITAVLDIDGIGRRWIQTKTRVRLCGKT